MTEEAQTQETTEATGQTELGITPETPDSPDNVRATPAFKGVEKEAAKHKAEAAKYQKQLEKLQAEQTKLDEAKLLEEKNWTELERLKDETIATKDAEIQTMKDKQHQTAIDLALRDAGILDEDARLGKTMRYLALEGDDKPTISEWIAQQKEAHPESFETRGTSMTTPRVGGTTTKPADNSLKARLKSTDKAVRDAAINEQGMKIWSGELASDWDKPD